MVGASKILTVSYGTFSCTLEGFDEPFSTMKAIAEYFRDLAADDRYFGAEPPTPDAQMLHQIAEREIQRRVEAKVQDNGVILRADGAEEAPARAAAPAVASLAAPVAAEAADYVADEPVAEEPVAEEAIAEEPVVEAPAAEAPAETPAAELPAEEPAFEESVAEPEPTPAPVAEDEASEIIDVSGDSVAAKLLRIRAAVAQARNAAAARKAARDEVAPIEAAPAPAPVAEAEAEAEADYTEDLPETDDEIDPAALAAFAAPHADAPGAEVAPVEEAAPALEDTVSSFLTALGGESHDEELAVEAETPVAGEEVAETEETETEDVAEVEELTASEEVAEVEAPAEPEDEVESEEVAEAEEPAMDATPEVAQAPAEDDTAEEDVAEEETAKDEAEAHDEALEEVSPAQRARARVIKVRRIDPRATVEPVEAEAVEPEPAPEAEPAQAEPEVAEAPQAVAETAEAEAPAETAEADDAVELSPEDEAELLAELAAVEREVEAGRRNDRAGRSILETGTEPQDEAVNRLMRQADSEQEGADNKRRIATIAHLKAAVAATAADKELGDEPEQPVEDAMQSYRDDLARVVRPRRPAAEGAGGPVTARPVAPADRPAPLVLVSEQRIDRPADAASAGKTIRPRRVTAGNLAVDESEDDESLQVEAGNIFDDSRSFAEFAEKIGATGLPDLLEAAAAYASCVEGRPHFSRPQIMRAAASVGEEGDDTFSREAGLRSFGMLLREGKIKKIKRGQFAISQSSRFIPEARKIAR